MPSDVVLRFDMATHQFERVTPLRYAKRNHSSTVIDNKLVIIGGFSLDNAAPISILDLKQSKPWQSVRPKMFDLNYLKWSVVVGLNNEEVMITGGL